MREEEVVSWLKSQGAIRTPPEMRGRLQKAGHHGLPSEEDRHSEKLKPTRAKAEMLKTEILKAEGEGRRAEGGKGRGADTLKS